MNEERGSSYLATRGMDDDVGGRILETRRRNTTIERRTFIVNPIFSPEEKRLKRVNRGVFIPDAVGR